MPPDGASAGRRGDGDGLAAPPLPRPAAPAAGRLLHASCVQIDGAGVIVRGASGSGKSDLCLRLIEAGGLLVADDQVRVERGDGGLLFASAPAGLAGLIEVRGVGILRLPRVAGRSPVRLVVDLCPRDQVVRLPERDQGDATCELLGVSLPRLGLDPFAASTCAKIGFALRVERVH